MTNINQDFLFIVGMFFIAADLIITGIIGLIKTEIYPKKIALQLFFLPIGLIGIILGQIYSKLDDETDKGKAAISSSIAAIGFGSLMFIFFGFYYLDTYGVVDYNALKILVPASLIILVILIPISTLFFEQKYKNI